MTAKQGGNGNPEKGWEKFREWLPKDKEQPLTQTEERRLFQELAEKRGNAHAIKKRLLLAHLRLPVFVAKRHARSSKELLDLIETGNLALMTALERYDFQKGYRFATYALWHIRQAIKKHLQ